MVANDAADLHVWSRHAARVLCLHSHTLRSPVLCELQRCGGFDARAEAAFVRWAMCALARWRNRASGKYRCFKYMDPRIAYCQSNWRGPT